MSDPLRTQAIPAVDPNRTIMGASPTLNATITIQPVQCPVCKTFNPAGMAFCSECGLIFDRALPDDAFGAPVVRLPVLVDSTGREHPLRPGANTIGREGDVQFIDGRVSRIHARITLSDGGVTLEDAGSTNGTIVEGERLVPGTPLALMGGEKLSFGGFEAQFTLPEGGPAGKTQAFATNKTAAMAAPPTIAEPVAARLVGEEESYPLKMGANSFGRREGNDIVIADPFISGKHGLIEVEADAVFITDTGSTNGTMLNDARLGANLRTRLEPEDVIRLGQRELRVVRGEA